MAGGEGGMDDDEHDELSEEETMAAHWERRWQSLKMSRCWETVPSGVV